MTTASVDRSSKTGGRWWPAVVAILLWTTVSFLVLLFDPGFEVYGLAMSQPPFTCQRLVGRSLACDDAVNAANTTWLWLHQYPMLLFIAAGYVAIAFIAIRGRRSRHESRIETRPTL